MGIPPFGSLPFRLPNLPALNGIAMPFCFLGFVDRIGFTIASMRENGRSTTRICRQNLRLGGPREHEKATAALEGGRLSYGS